MGSLISSHGAGDTAYGVAWRVGRKQPDGPGDSSNERVSDAHYRSARRCNVVEERAGRHSPNDRHTKIHDDGDP